VGPELKRVLHAFRKKSRRGIKTSRADIDNVKARLRLAEEIHARRSQSKGEGEVR
jgi:phage-related protein